MAKPDPLEDARTLLAISRLLHRARQRASLRGVQPAGAAADRLVPLGVALKSAVEAAEQADAGPERVRTLAEVARLGDELVAQIDDRWEALSMLMAEAVHSVRGEKPRRPGS